MTKYFLKKLLDILPKQCKSKANYLATGFQLQKHLRSLMPKRLNQT